MAETIHIEVKSEAHGLDLVDALAVRGLTARLARIDSRWELEIGYEYEETERLIRDVVEALESWLADRGYPECTLRIGKRPLRVWPRRAMAA